jgi:hypothetical protein
MSSEAAIRRCGASGRSAGVRAACGRGAIVAVLLSMSACLASRDLKSHELIGGTRPPTSPDSVQLYLEPPSLRYEQIAVLHASSRRSWSFTSQTKADVVVKRLKEEAASLGANGVLLQQIADGSGVSVGTDVGTNYLGPRGTVDLGIGVSALAYQRYGRAIAIYLPR